MSTDTDTHQLNGSEENELVGAPAESTIHTHAAAASGTPAGDHDNTPRDNTSTNNSNVTTAALMAALKPASTATTTETATSESDPNSAAIAVQDQPLSHTWCFYFDDGNFRPGIASSSSASSSTAFLRSLITLGSFSSIQSFWSYFNSVDLQIHKICSQTGSGRFNLRLFKQGIQPVWDHTPQGGKWVIKATPSSDIKRTREIWLELVMACVGEQLPQKRSIAGCVLTCKPHRNEVQLWVTRPPYEDDADADSNSAAAASAAASSDHHQQSQLALISQQSHDLKLKSIAHSMRRILRLSDSIRMSYVPHEYEQEKRRASERNDRESSSASSSSSSSSKRDRDRDRSERDRADRRKVRDVSTKTAKSTTWPSRPDGEEGAEEHSESSSNSSAATSASTMTSPSSSSSSIARKERERVDRTERQRERDRDRTTAQQSTSSNRSSTDVRLLAAMSLSANPLNDDQPVDASRTNLEAMLVPQPVDEDEVNTTANTTTTTTTTVTFSTTTATLPTPTPTIVTLAHPPSSSSLPPQLRFSPPSTTPPSFHRFQISRDTLPLMQQSEYEDDGRGVLHNDDDSDPSSHHHQQHSVIDNTSQMMVSPSTLAGPLASLLGLSMISQQNGNVASNLMMHQQQQQQQQQHHLRSHSNSHGHHHYPPSYTASAPSTITQPSSGASLPFAPQPMLPLPSPALQMMIGVGSPSAAPVSVPSANSGGVATPSSTTATPTHPSTTSLHSPVSYPLIHSRGSSNGGQMQMINPPPGLSLPQNAITNLQQQPMSSPPRPQQPPSIVGGVHVHTQHGGITQQQQQHPSQQQQSQSQQQQVRSLLNNMSLPSQPQLMTKAERKAALEWLGRVQAKQGQAKSMPILQGQQQKQQQQQQQQQQINVANMLQVQAQQLQQASQQQQAIDVTRMRMMQLAQAQAQAQAQQQMMNNVKMLNQQQQQFMQQQQPTPHQLQQFQQLQQLHQQQQQLQQQAQQQQQFNNQKPAMQHHPHQPLPHNPQQPHHQLNSSHNQQHQNTLHSPTKPPLLHSNSTPNSTQSSTASSLPVASPSSGGRSASASTSSATAASITPTSTVAASSTAAVTVTPSSTHAHTNSFSSALTPLDSPSTSVDTSATNSTLFTSLPAPHAPLVGPNPAPMLLETTAGGVSGGSVNTVTNTSTSPTATQIYSAGVLPALQLTASAADTLVPPSTSSGTGNNGSQRPRSRSLFWNGGGGIAGMGTNALLAAHGSTSVGGGGGSRGSIHGGTSGGDTLSKPSPPPTTSTGLVSPLLVAFAAANDEAIRNARRNSLAAAAGCYGSVGDSVEASPVMLPMLSLPSPAVVSGKDITQIASSPLALPSAPNQATGGLSLISIASSSRDNDHHPELSVLSSLSLIPSTITDGGEESDASARGSTRGDGDESSRPESTTRQMSARVTPMPVPSSSSKRSVAFPASPIIPSTTSSMTSASPSTTFKPMSRAERKAALAMLSKVSSKRAQAQSWPRSMMSMSAGNSQAGSGLGSPSPVITPGGGSNAFAPQPLLSPVMMSPFNATPTDSPRTSRGNSISGNALSVNVGDPRPKGPFSPAPIFISPPVSTVMSRAASVTDTSSNAAAYYSQSVSGTTTPSGMHTPGGRTVQLGIGLRSRTKSTALPTYAMTGGPPMTPPVGMRSNSNSSQQQQQQHAPPSYVRQTPGQSTQPSPTASNTASPLMMSLNSAKMLPGGQAPSFEKTINAAMSTTPPTASNPSPKAAYDLTKSPSPASLVSPLITSPSAATTASPSSDHRMLYMIIIGLLTLLLIVLTLLLLKTREDAQLTSQLQQLLRERHAAGGTNQQVISDLLQHNPNMNPD